MTRLPGWASLPQENLLRGTVAGNLTEIVACLIGGPCAALFLTESVTGAKLNVPRAVDQAEAILLEVMKRAQAISYAEED